MCSLIISSSTKTTCTRKLHGGMKWVLSHIAPLNLIYSQRKYNRKIYSDFKEEACLRSVRFLWPFPLLLHLHADTSNYSVTMVYSIRLADIMCKENARRLAVSRAWRVRLVVKPCTSADDDPSRLVAHRWLLVGSLEWTLEAVVGDSMYVPVTRAHQISVRELRKKEMGLPFTESASRTV